MSADEPPSIAAEGLQTIRDDLRNSLWRVPLPLSPEDARVAFAQYQLYVELADRVSARRANANTFFITLNTGVFTLLGVFWETPPDASKWFGIFPTLVLTLECIAWFYVVRSYRQLSTAKWAVVGALEESLPASPWWRAEWRELGMGGDPSKYWPLTHIEQWVPVLFALAYLGGFCAVLVV
ncbi:MAG: RipA family octameric membrane protein [Phycicoccus sp.]